METVWCKQRGRSWRRLTLLRRRGRPRGGPRPERPTGWCKRGRRQRARCRGPVQRGHPPGRRLLASPPPPVRSVPPGEGGIGGGGGVATHVAAAVAVGGRGSPLSPPLPACRRRRHRLRRPRAVTTRRRRRRVHNYGVRLERPAAAAAAGAPAHPRTRGGVIGRRPAGAAFRRRRCRRTFNIQAVARAGIALG